jgi:hypothetical protein
VIAKTAVTHAGCLALQAARLTLTSLDMSFNPKVGHGAFFAGGFPNLTELDCSLNAWVDDATLATLVASAPRLRKLTLEKTDVTDEGVASLGALAPTLQYLDLSRTGVCFSTAESHAALARMGALRSLLLMYTEIGLELALHLPRGVERLKLSRALNFTDDALHCLAQRGLPSLTALDVGSPYVTDAALPALEALAAAGLVSLTLWHCKVPRQAAERLMAATGLARDTSMQATEGTYILKRPAGGSAAELRAACDVQLF